MAVGSYLDLAPPLTAQGIERPASNTAPIGGNLTATTFRDIAEAQTAMVITIWTEQRRPQVTRNEFFRRGEESFGGEDFRRFFGQPPGFDRNRSGERNEDQDEQESTPLAATGTGFVIEDDGLILTNNHVVENATSIQIRFYGDDERYAARVLGRDRLTDSALLELVERPARKLPAARFGDSSRYGAGRLGDGHRRALRPQPHGTQSGSSRRSPGPCGRCLIVPTRSCRPTRRSTRQLRWPAAEHPRRGHRHEHGHHQRLRIELGRRLRRADQHGAGPLLGELRGGKVTPRRHRRADRRGAE